MIRTDLKRSGIKAVTWRIAATLTTMIIVYIYTGKMDQVFGIGISEVIIKMILYFLHERVWDHISLGRSVKAD